MLKAQDQSSRASSGQYAQGYRAGGERGGDFPAQVSQNDRVTVHPSSGGHRLVEDRAGERIQNPAGTAEDGQSPD